MRRIWDGIVAGLRRVLYELNLGERGYLFHARRALDIFAHMSQDGPSAADTSN